MACGWPFLGAIIIVARVGTYLPILTDMSAGYMRNLTATTHNSVIIFHVQCKYDQLSINCTCQSDRTIVNLKESSKNLDPTL